MRIHTNKTGKEQLIIIPLPEGFEKKVLAKKLQHLLEKNQYFTGKEEQNILMQGKTDMLILGIGKAAQDEIRKFGARAAVYARDNHYTDYAIDVTAFPSFVQAGVEGSLLGLYQYREYKKRSKDEAKDPVNLTIIAEEPANKAVKEGKILAESTMMVRDLVNRPASDKYPTKITEIAKKLGKQHRFEVKVLGKKELEKLGMNAMLAVNRGSDKEAQLVIMELGKGKETTALVGKGVTFDAGGLQVKPGAFMIEMKSDMAGAATVLGTIVALARLGYKGKVIGAMGLVENVIGPDAYKPGDILKACNGKTIEIGHTDAEGRLVLADTMSYLEKHYKPERIIDLATLTGAAIVALGPRVTPVIGTDEELIKDIKEASAATDELVWELPLYNHYKKLMESKIADINNLGKKPTPYGGPGTITAAAFLSNFVSKAKWAHLDIAGTAYAYEKTVYVAEGGTGWGVRLLTKLITG